MAVEIPEKLYFRIGEVSRLTKTPEYVLRFWETQFPMFKPKKGSTGQRMFRRKEVEMVLEIRQLLYQQGFTIEGTPLGEGQVPLDWVLHELRRHGRCQSATLEHWVPPEATREDTIRKERAWCSRSAATMRRLLPTSFAAAP